jgi:hypothetical protein
MSSNKERTTYFGLKIYTIDNQDYVREKDIKKLPFYDFWKTSAKGSTCITDDKLEDLIYLYDWENFSVFFIKTGKHRYM